MKRCVYDIEGDNLLHEATTVHCMVIYDLDTKETFKYRPDTMEEGYKHLMTFDQCIGHNVLGYDKPTLEKFWGHLGPLPKHDDTYIMSRIMWGPKDSPAGMHSLKAWGEFLGNKKDEFDDWSEFTEEMLDYCTQDVMVNVDILEYIRKEWDPKCNYAYRLECDVRSIITEQELNGFHLDPVRHQELTQYLVSEQARLQDEIDKVVPPDQLVMKTRLFYWATPDPTLDNPNPKPIQFKTKTMAKDNGFKDRQITPGPFKTKKVTFNANSTPQLVEYFQQKYNWQPNKFTDAGNASMSGDVLESLDFPEAPLFNTYQTILKRLSQVESWTKFVKDGKIHGNVHTVGPATYRMSHSDPNVAQVTAKGKEYGVDCRKCWTARPGWKLVGTDAKGLELRMLANALAPFDNGAYIPVVCDQDPHEYNNQLAGIGDRTVAKICIYAFTYGGGLVKLGMIAKDSEVIRKDSESISLPGGYIKYLEESGQLTEEYMNAAKRGIAVKRRFMENIDGFADLLDSLAEEWKENGSVFIRGIDGRRIPCEANNILLNRSLQSAGAIVMKVALRIHYRTCTQRFGKHGGRWAYCANIHDEFQVECEPEIAEEMAKIGADSIRLAGEELNLLCPQAGDSNIGNSWYETH